MDVMQNFDGLKTRLRIDPGDMDNELIHLPQYIEEISEHVAKALSNRDAASNDLKRVIAEEDHRIRSEEWEKKPTEKQIEASVSLSKRVRDATLDLEDAKYNYALWMGLMEGARAKSSAIEILARLWISGYFTPNTVQRMSREEMAERRSQRPALTKREVKE